LSPKFKDSYKEMFSLIESCPGDFVFIKGNEANEAKFGSLGTVECVLGRLDIKNKNGRVYSREFWEKLLQSKEFQYDLKNRRLTGEMDHPEGVNARGKETSHIVTKVWIEGDKVLGWVEVLDSPAGTILYKLLKSGILYGISSRGYGESESKEGVEYIKPGEFVMKGWDFVQDPSTVDGYVKHISQAEGKIIARAVQSFKDPRVSLGRLAPCFESFMPMQKSVPAIHGVAEALSDKVSRMEKENRILRSERDYIRDEMKRLGMLVASLERERDALKDENAKQHTQLQAFVESLAERDTELKRLEGLKVEVKKLESVNEKIKNDFAKTLESTGIAKVQGVRFPEAPVTHHTVELLNGASSRQVGMQEQAQPSRLEKLLERM